MKRFDIDKELSMIVSTYLLDGWTINTKSMSGHQGEEGKVDLVKDDQLVRIWLEKCSNFSNWSDKNAWHGSTLHLRVGTWNRPASDSINYDWTTVWFDDIDIFCDKVFYEISNNWYVTDLVEALRIQSCRSERWLNKNRPYRNQEVYFTDERIREIASRYLKRKAGYQRVHKYKIEVKKILSVDDMQYCIKYNGSRYCLH